MDGSWFWKHESCLIFFDRAVGRHIFFWLDQGFGSMKNGIFLIVLLDGIFLSLDLGFGSMNNGFFWILLFGGIFFRFCLGFGSMKIGYLDDDRVVGLHIFFGCICVLEA